MVFLTLKLIVFKNISEFFLTLLFFFFLSNCNRALLWTGAITFLVKYKFFDLFLFYLMPSWLCYYFFWKKLGHKFLDGINVCCCLVLLLVLPRFLNNGRSHLMWHFLLDWNICGGGDFFVHNFFLKNAWFFLGFLSVLMLISGVGTLCANAQYRASLFFCNDIQFNAFLKGLNGWYAAATSFNEHSENCYSRLHQMAGAKF